MSAVSLDDASTEKKMTNTTLNTNTNTNTTTKTHSESDVYDRQIRLWGAESQAKMQKSKVLYVHVTGVSAEVLKNLVLAGIKATLCDPRPVEEVGVHFFTPPKTVKKMKASSIAHSVKPLVEELNPLLGECPLLEKPCSELTEEDLQEFTVVVASKIPLEEAVRLAKLTTANGAQFYVGDCFGLNGCAMIDLGKDFRYRPEQGKALLDPVPLKEYVSLEDAVQVPLYQAVNRFHKTPPPVWVQYRCLMEHYQKTGSWPDENSDSERSSKLLRAFLEEQKVTSMLDEELNTLIKAGMAQVAPVCAVLGGMLGNEIIKVISGKGEPANNTLLLNGSICKAWTFLVKPKV